MKKIVLIATIAVLMLGLCACGSETVAVDGKEIVIEPGESIIFAEGEFVVKKTEVCYHYASSGGRYDYLITVENDTYSILFEADAKCYALWNENDVIQGQLIKRNGCNTQFEVGASRYTIMWYGEKTS